MNHPKPKPSTRAEALPNDFRAKRAAREEIEAIQRQVERDLRGVADLLTLWRLERLQAGPVVAVGPRQWA